MPGNVSFGDESKTTGAPSRTYSSVAVRIWVTVPCAWLTIRDVRSSFSRSSLKLRLELADFKLPLKSGALPQVFRGQLRELQLRQP